MCYVPFRDLGRREVELTKNGSMLSRRTRPLRTTVRCPAIWEVKAETLLLMSHIYDWKCRFSFQTCDTLKKDLNLKEMAAKKSLMYCVCVLLAFDNVFIVCSVLETIRKHFGNSKNYNLLKTIFHSNKNFIKLIQPYR